MQYYYLQYTNTNTNSSSVQYYFQFKQIEIWYETPLSHLNWYVVESKHLKLSMINVYLILIWSRIMEL